MDTVLYIVYGLFTLGILVFVHELGHFVVGKACGIRVTAFSIGFGRGIFSFERGGTLYKIGWLPIGGYCRFAGEGEDLANDKKGEPDEFYERPAWARLATVSAGVTFNFILAILIFFILSLTGYSYKSNDNSVTVADKVLLPTETSFPAEKAGLLTGDRIVAVNGVATPDFRRLQEEIAVRPDSVLVLDVVRGTNRLALTVRTGIRDTGMGYIGILPFYGTVIREVLPGTPAAGAGLAAGDRLVAFAGQPLESLHKLRTLVAASKTNRVEVAWERSGRKMQARIAAVQKDGDWLLGLRTVDPEIKTYQTATYSVGGAIGNSFALFGQNIQRIVEGIGLLFRKEVDTGKALAGPVRIVHFSGQVLKESTTAGYLTFLAMISIALGFFNLLPIPAADGGHIVLTLIEMVRRKRFTFEVLRRIQLTGIIILMTLFVSVFFFDIMNIVGQ